MTNEDPSAAAVGGGRTPRQGSGGSPVGSTLSIVLAVIAVVAGFLILRNITDDGGGSASGDAAGSTGEPVTSDAITTTTFDVTDTTTTTSTTIPRVTEGATVVVANGNSIGGSAGRMSKTLELVGYTMGAPVNANVTLDDTIVYFDASVTSAEAVAQSVGVDMGCVDVLPAGTPVPTDSGSLGEAGVLVVLGNEQADKTIEEMAVEGCLVAVDAPAVSGSEEEIIAPITTEG